MGDLIERQKALDAIQERIGQLGHVHNPYVLSITKAIRKLPSAEPEIIYCKDCKRHNVGIEDYREENGKRHWYWKDEVCPLVRYRGKAQGHEFDYQFCVYAERRTDE